MNNWKPSTGATDNTNVCGDEPPPRHHDEYDARSNATRADEVVRTLAVEVRVEVKVAKGPDATKTQRTVTATL